jgi:hypothetical protein
LIRQWRTGLGRLVGADDPGLVDQLTALEELKRSIGAAQARLSVTLADSQRAEQLKAGVPAEKLGMGVAAQIALARKEPPSRGARLLMAAEALVEDMPNTLASLSEGQISEWAAAVIVKATAELSGPDRACVDAAIATSLATLSDSQLDKTARALAQQADPSSVHRRTRRAIGDRAVSYRTEDDSMSTISARLPVADGLAVDATLRRAADRARARGDDRTRAQVMADTLVEAITGRRASYHRSAVRPGANGAARVPAIEATGSPEARRHAGPAADGIADPAGSGQVSAARSDEAVGAGVTTVPHLTPDELLSMTVEPQTEPPTWEPEGDRAGPVRKSAEPDSGSACAPLRPSDIELRLVMTDTALFGGGDAASLNDEPIPAWLARDLVTDPQTRVRLRRIFTHPASGQLIAMESMARTFTGGLRDVVLQRDQRCRTPWCGAPIRHVDHVNPDSRGGRTTADNAQGLCEACNYAKEAPGWRAEVIDAADGSAPGTRLVTPTGHHYDSHPPPLLPTLVPATRALGASYGTTVGKSTLAATAVIRTIGQTPPVARRPPLSDVGCQPMATTPEPLNNAKAYLIDGSVPQAVADDGTAIGGGDMAAANPARRSRRGQDPLRSGAGAPPENDRGSVSIHEVPLPTLVNRVS